MPYETLEDANEAIKGIDPAVNLVQANKIAEVADSIGGEDGWPIAIDAFKNSHEIAEADGRKLWVRKAKSMTCPICQAEIPFGASTCPKCGAEVVYETKGYRSNLTKDDFLVVEDGELRTTWHLPITKEPGGNPDRALCGAAWAALHEGLRGRKYAGPKKQEAIDKLVKIYEDNEWALPGTKSLDSGLLELDAEVFSSQPIVVELPETIIESVDLHIEHKEEFPITITTLEDPNQEQVQENLLTTLGVDSLEVLHGFKMLDGKLILWTTNAFQDDEKEIFATQTLEDYVGRKDAGQGSRGRVWFWHVPGSDFADIKWQGVVDRYLVEVAEFDNTPYAMAMKEALSHPENYKELLPYGWGVSQGYLYRPTDKKQGVYTFMEKYESSVLPLHRAANKFTGVQGVIEAMKEISEEKKRALAALVGDELAGKVLQGTSEASEALTAMGIAFKEQGEKAKAKKVVEIEVDEEDEEEVPDEEMEVEEEMLEEEEKEEYQTLELELDDDALQQLASGLPIDAAVKEYLDGNPMEVELDDAMLGQIVDNLPLEKAIKEVMQEVVSGDAFQKAIQSVVASELNSRLPELAQALYGAKEQVAKEALSGKIHLRPYSASRASDTVIATQPLDTGKKESQDVVASLVQNMLRGNV